MRGRKNKGGLRMPDSKKKVVSPEVEKEMRIKYSKTSQCLLLKKAEIASSSDNRPRIRKAAEACFQKYMEEELEIRRLKEKEKK
jgi:hypothetical protein